MPWAVALNASQSGMPPFQRVPRRTMIELILRFRPSDNAEVAAVVFGMTARAIDVSLSPIEVPGVITTFPIEEFPDIAMASKAPQPR
jgi:hypothetical protein